MICRGFWVTGLVVSAFTLMAAVALAQEPGVSDEEIATAKAAARAADLTDAIAEFKLMSDFLSAQKSFSFEAQYGFDSIQANGLMLEFGGTRKATIRRPDRARVEVTGRDGETSTLFFDGKVISVDLPDDKAYVSVQKPGTLDAAIDYLADDLDTPAPLADLFRSNVLAEVIDDIDAGLVVGEDTIAGTACFHVAIRSQAVDVQLWVADGEQPLLQRLIITYKTAPGSPQFWAQFSNWDLHPKTPDELFVYTPPKGAEQIPIGAAVASAQREREGIE